MAKKIFVSYKHNDQSVKPLKQYLTATARDYVDELEKYFEEGDFIYKGEDVDNDLSNLTDGSIAQILYDKIYDSSVTIVLVSKNMRDYKTEKDQWIPREISYSLTENNRGERISATNAMLAVVLPDENGDYSYIVTHHPCVTRWNTASLFNILNQNMFNRKSKNTYQCTDCYGQHHTGKDHSYIHPVKWDDFILDIDGYINLATEIQQNIDEYDIAKEL
ncbi:MAG: hypothetical protein BWY19_00305 [bacterium ADurb.Bin212]|nr:MAG: hypothetical protein BWY19_00305 [bacterium ADurb.Bin212]